MFECHHLVCPIQALLKRKCYRVYKHPICKTPCSEINLSARIQWGKSLLLCAYHKTSLKILSQQDQSCTQIYTYFKSKKMKLCFKINQLVSQVGNCRKALECWQAL